MTTKETKTLASHTSGPWVVFQDRTTDGMIFTVMPAGRPGDIATNIENGSDARLIAAAPDMLRELIEILEWAKVEKAPLRKQEIEHIAGVIAKATAVSP